MLDSITNLAYLLTMPFTSLAMFVSACVFYLLPTAIACRYLLWGTAKDSNGQLQPNRVLIRPRLAILEMPSWMTFKNDKNVAWKRVLETIALLPFLLLNSPFLLIWLLAGAVLLNLKVMAIVAVQKLWYRVWSSPYRYPYDSNGKAQQKQKQKQLQTNAASRSVAYDYQHMHRDRNYLLLKAGKEVLDTKLLNELIYLTGLLESIPWVAIQIANNVSLEVAVGGVSDANGQGWTAFSIASLLFSIASGVLTVARICYHRFFSRQERRRSKNRRICDVPVEIIVPWHRTSSRSSSGGVIDIADLQQEQPVFSSLASAGGDDDDAAMNVDIDIIGHIDVIENSGLRVGGGGEDEEENIDELSEGFYNRDIDAFYGYPATADDPVSPLHRLSDEDEGEYYSDGREDEEQDEDDGGRNRRDRDDIALWSRMASAPGDLPLNRTLTAAVKDDRRRRGMGSGRGSTAASDIGIIDDFEKISEVTLFDRADNNSDVSNAGIMRSQEKWATRRHRHHRHPHHHQLVFATDDNLEF